MAQLQLIQQKIFDIRSQKVMLDFDLAELYEVETRILNQAIKRNKESFPDDFMFQLTFNEWKELSSSQIVMMVNLPKNRTGKYLPYAFTEHGVTMLASVLKSQKARQMNIAIVRAFIAMRKLALQYSDVLEKISEISERVNNHDVRLNQIYEAIENLLKQKEVQEEWMENRKRIGFKQQL
ncbi:MAG: ORF6N domain-containing protein [Bacteroidota bacterium]|nr:ORF6N domain-containing protein [Bacteroidota bacterium]